MLKSFFFSDIRFSEPKIRCFLIIVYQPMRETGSDRRQVWTVSPAVHRQHADVSLVVPSAPRPRDPLQLHLSGNLTLIDKTGSIFGKHTSKPPIARSQFRRAIRIPALVAGRVNKGNDCGETAISVCSVSPLHTAHLQTQRFVKRVGFKAGGNYRSLPKAGPKDSPLVTCQD